MMILSCLVILPDGARASTSANISVLASSTVPTAPINLTADAGNGFVWLWWEHPANQGSDLIKNYTIYRNATSSTTNFVLLDTVLIGVNFYNDTNVSNGVTYKYKISANSDAGAGAYSDVATVTPVASATAPGAVQNLVAVNHVYSVQLNWTSPASAGSTPIRHIYVYGQDFFGFTQIADLSPTAIGYVDTTVLPGNTYHYVVRAISSTWGSAQASTSVAVGGTGPIPGSPENLTAASGYTSIVLSWDNPANPSASGISNYTIYRSDSLSGPFTYIGNRTTSSFFGYFTYYSDILVVFGHKYYYEVRSNNANGSSAPSNIANATLTTFPLTLSAYPGNGQVLLTWIPLFNATAYDIYRSTVEGVTGTISNSSYSTSRYYWYDNSTTNGNIYYYTLRANLNNVSYQFSNQANTTPYAGTPPVAPTNLIATPDSSGVNLYANIATHTDIYIGYSIYRGNSPGTESTTPIVNQTTVPYYSYLALYHTLNVPDDSALTDVNYTYYVTVWNLFGQSPHSNEATSFRSPTGDAPDPITNLAAVGGSGQVTLTWNKPTYQGTANLLYYSILRYNGTAWNYISSLAAGLGQQTYVDNLLNPGTDYQYRVEVSNNYGNAIALSNVAQATTTVSNVIPSAPLNLVASSGAGYIQLSWGAPTTAGPGITNYKIFRGTTAAGEGTTVFQTVSGSTLAYNDTTVTAGQIYYYEVAAVNSIGTGPDSNEVNGMAPVASAPSAPLGLTAFASAGQIQLNWSAPSSVGTGITEYRIFRGTTSGGEGTTPIATVSGTILTFTDVNVVTGTPYEYTVTAVNAAGMGLASNEASATAVTVSGVPTPPTGLTALAGSNYVLLNWTTPTTVGGGITAYKVYRGTSASGETATAIANLSGTTLTYNDSSVTAGVPYYYLVKAVNANGISDPSNEATTTVVNPLVPSAPKNVVATPGAGKIVLTWDIPDSNGATALTGYQIFRSVNGSQLTLIGNTTASVRTFTDTNVDTSHTYGYVIAANNANGSSSTSTQVSATPNAAAASSTDNTMLYAGIGIIAIIIVVILAAWLMLRGRKPVASAPIGLNAFAAVGNIQLRWSAPSKVGGGITEYRVFRGTKEGVEDSTPITTVSGTTLIWNDSAIVAGTSYYYVVRAVNSAGVGAASNEVSVTAING
ncbi:MAG: fibronectin type III domain-containing protein [Methanomassiliicoccales archaeon]|jgi:fibronectin type 3 domain-containing protein